MDENKSRFFRDRRLYIASCWRWIRYCLCICMYVYTHTETRFDVFKKIKIYRVYSFVYKLSYCCCITRIQKKIFLLGMINIKKASASASWLLILCFRCIEFEKNVVILMISLNMFSCVQAFFDSLNSMHGN